MVPIDRGMCIPAVHAEEAARAIVLATRQRKSGIYNIASDVPATGADVLAGLSVHGLHVPSRLLRAAAQVTWRLHLQPVDGGWIDRRTRLARGPRPRPRPRRVGLGPHTEGPDVVRELAEGMVDRAGTGSPVLEDRSVLTRLTSALRRGEVGTRKPT